MPIGSSLATNSSGTIHETEIVFVIVVAIAFLIVVVLPKFKTKSKGAQRKKDE